jgi:serine/threonine protein kinase
MGEVYRARDARLGRDVAIKVLPESFAGDPDRLARFEREAQLLASLNHPNIATIHGLEESAGVRALVMELVEGLTLAEKLAQDSGLKAHGLPLDEALPIARQIAEALETAHERGVIHRDLKPANIKITPSGQVKVLDFGLAKMLEGAGGGQQAAGSYGLTLSPTLSVQATYAGVILGTAAYMSPEQARGKPVDRRADVWAFGCVLFEMLTGKQAFETGETVSDAVAAILKNEPDWNALPADTPAHIRTLLRRCLQKDPQKRLPHIGVARIEIDEPSSAAAVSTSETPKRSYAWPLTAIAIVAMLLLFVAWRSLQDDAAGADAVEMRTEIIAPTTADPISFALSPDGRRIVFVASGNGPSRLWFRSLATSSARPLDGTEGATYPFWSPDSRSVGFFAEGKLKRLDLTGGAPQVWTTLTTGGRGGTWNEDGDVLFGTTGSTLMRISASGGPVRAITKLERQASHRFPKFLPNGRRWAHRVSRGRCNASATDLVRHPWPDARNFRGAG